MSCSFANQVITQVELFSARGRYERQVHRWPKELDEKVARTHVRALGGELTELTDDQSKYIGIPVRGPYKPEHYCY
ncbi:adenosylhomocysteinase [Streptomyces sp. NPDC050610]|uniref:adenosylhomocysteinase n=1 Tax=Streptomyces sp. NPDC050610 TaxID=3157097 RepID=UPI00343A534D